MKTNNSFNKLCKDIDKAEEESLLPLENINKKLCSIIGDDKTKFTNIYVECISFNPNSFNNQITNLINISLALLTVTLTILLSINNFVIQYFTWLYPCYASLIFGASIVILVYLCYLLIKRLFTNHYMLKWRNYVLYSLQCYAKDKNWDIPKDFTV